MNRIIDKKILNNISWLVVDKVIILTLQFLVGVKVANYYGTKLYGDYSYAMALFSFSPILLEIVNSRIIKEFYKENFNETVCVVTTVRMILSLIIVMISVFSYFLLKENLILYLILILLTIDNFILSTTFGIENYFEYKLQSRDIVLANNISKIISYTLQYISILYGYSILIIPIIRIIGDSYRMVILKKKYLKFYRKKIKISFNKELIKTLVKDSYYLWISLIAFILYTQIDRIMIKNFLNISDVGIYSIAIQLSSILGILIIPFQNSIYPKLMKLHNINYDEYIKLYLKINTIFTQIYIYISLLSIIVVKYSFLYIYKKEYEPAIICYGILAISIVFKANGALQTGHMTLKKITKKIFFKTILGLIGNILLNIILIPKYGIKGAAIATSITEIFSIFFIDYFIKEYREQFFIQLKSFNPLNMKG